MLEDDTYRASSQYRLWSFTTEQLQDKRLETNRLACEKVQASFKRSRLAGNLSLVATAADDGHGISGPSSTTGTPEPSSKRADEFDGEVNPLTADEEQRMVQWGCEKILELQDTIFPRPGAIVVCTAIQFLRRFYLSNSPMTYHPRHLLTSALWLAFKAEHYTFLTLTKFTAQLHNVTDDDVKAPEFLLMQSLRFTLDVKHPMRGLEGCVSDMQRMTDLGDLVVESKKGAAMKDRIDRAFAKGRALCVRDVQMTDAYFLFTPPQIHLACLLIVDKSLTLSYLEALFDRLTTRVGPIKQKLIDTIAACAKVIGSYKSQTEDKSKKKELARIGKKLAKCQDPEKKDIVGNEKAKLEKSFKGGQDSDDEDRRQKKRFKKEDDGEVFGPGLTDVKLGKAQ
ncbi:hypothetical protein LTR05_006513 [Lithohypha guttulata]|uniref:Cyclin C-terminal domain-containing protein n=1 Tax=Lithohypha guttulata TaxID=1690604 RepID=A0AAN7SVE0_9EURO|nr:hypothetical protein LTR05_006513 [Lithohypha guttulata]